MSTKEPNIQSLKNVLACFFATMTKSERVKSDSQGLLQAIVDVYDNTPNPDVYQFSLDDDSIAQAVLLLKNQLKEEMPERFQPFGVPLTYLLDELICNIQQHACATCGYVYLHYNKNTEKVEIIVADKGITIYGSYVAAQKHLDKLGNSDAEALILAQNGYSVKNLPETENRGYGISSNIKMVVDGLRGEFAVMSGNALLIQSPAHNEVLSLPSDVDIKGTMIVISFPAKIPEGFNLYNYTC